MLSGMMKIFVEFDGRTKKITVEDLGNIMDIISKKFEVQSFRLEYRASDSRGGDVWVELEEVDDLTEACCIRVLRLRYVNHLLYTCV